MNDYIYLSIGYPIGFLFDTKKDIFHVEIDGEAKEISDRISFIVWSKFLGGALHNDIKQEIIKEEKINENEFDEIINNLLKQKLLIKVGNDIDVLMNDLKNKVLLRQGFAIERDKQNNKYSIIMSKKHDLDIREYSIWILSDGKNTIFEIMNAFEFNQLEEVTKYELIGSLITLYNKGLIYIV